MSLAELLVALAALGFLLGATVTALGQGQRLYAFGAARVETQQSARAALYRMAAEIRQAGFGPATGGPAISVAEPARVTIHLDLDQDGVIARRRETITWLLRGRVLRREAGGGAQPVINGVRDLRFDYFDAAGRPTAVPADVRAVAITVTTEPDHLAADPARRAQVTLVTRVRLRNR